MKDTPAVMPHLHLAVQSGSTRVLKKMNRNYIHEEYLDVVSPSHSYSGLALSADIIVGFPGD